MRSVPFTAGRRRRRLLLAAGALVLPLALAGCNDKDNPGLENLPNFPESDHPHVVLRDRAGNQLAANSTEPYSPRRTCGECHNVNEVARGYHFQQGRTDSDGNFIMEDDYFGDGRDYLLSPGMYGKW